ncbi:MAG: carboxypeptidase [Kutzneria sp.]|nr:carboxypeptidase [Kutzneria sp.]
MPGRSEMVRRRVIPLSGVLTVVAAVAILLLPQAATRSAVAAPAPGANPTAQPDYEYVYRVANAVASADKLVSGDFDVMERRDGNDLFVLGTAADGPRLAKAGFSATVESARPAASWTPPKPRLSNDHLSPADVGETYYGGYHTVNAQYAHLDQAAAQHPDLATTVTYGQSWLKSQGRGGYDLRAICITKKQAGDCQLNPNSAKPRFFLMSQIHAREITTGDVSWHWVDYLVNGYGTDNTVKALLDSTELWVVPVVNPDGVDIVQQGGNSPKLQRKNADGDPARCTVSGGQLGVDLNRNNGSHWGGASTSTGVCNEVYRGPSQDSEVEDTALQKLFTQLWPARRGTGVGDPAPADTRGVMMTLHSDASLVLYPWGYDSTVHTGNDASLRAMAKQMGTITHYDYGQPGAVLYDASGTTDDWSYDKLGVASFTIEVGDETNGGCGGFLPPHSCQDSFFWPKMMPALVYAAQQAPAPYANH